MHSPEEIEAMRAELRERYQVPEEELDEVLAIALKLKAEGAPGPGGAPAGEDDALVHALSLSEPPASDELTFEEEAPSQRARMDMARAVELRAERNAAYSQAVQAKVERVNARRTVFGVGLRLVSALVLFACLGWLGASIYAAAPINEARRDTYAVQTRLDALFIDQANIAPRIVELGGPESLNALAQEVLHAAPGAERLAASDTLWVAMCEALGELPIPGTYTAIEEQQAVERDLAESHKRFLSEHRLYVEKVLAWEETTRARFADWALSLNMARPPSPALVEAARRSR